MRGNLVINGKGEYAIVVDTRRDKLIILLGDGLQVEVPAADWQTVPFGWGGTSAAVPGSSIPCCFVELLPVFLYSSPDDWRVKMESLAREVTDFKDQMIGMNHDLSRIADIVNRIEKIPRQIMDRIKGRAKLEKDSPEG